MDCLSISEALREILEKEEVIDILKVDTEGAEIRTVKAIGGDLIKRIKRIYLEAEPEELLHPEAFDQHQYGGVCQLTNRALRT